MKLAIVKKLSPAIDKAKFVLDKRSPEIWLGAGVLAIIGGTIWACHATRKLDGILDNRDYNMKMIESQKEDDDELRKECAEDGEEVDISDLHFKTEREYKKSRALVTINVAGQLVREYAPAALLIGGGIGMVVKGNYILSKRNAALLSAYKALEETFVRYRTKVAEKIGKDTEEQLYSGRSYDTVTITDIDENGKKTKRKEQIQIVGDGLSPYMVIYDKDSSTEWTTSSTFNHSFLIGQQNAINDLFRVRNAKMKRKGKRGWIMLNEVYEMLGLDQTSTGAICGWLGTLEGEEAEGDDYIDFGIIEDEENQRYVLNFNCQGMIYDKI